VFSILTAIWHRNHTGEGQHIDFAQNEAVINTLADAMMEYTMNGRELFMRGNRDPRFVPQGVYRCAGPDDWVALSVAGDDEFETLCRVMGMPDLVQDSRFHTVLARYRHHEELDALITTWTRQRTNIEVQELLQRAGIAAGAAIDSEQLLADPQLHARGFFVEIDHDEVGPATYGGWPVHFSDADPVIRKAPLFGQHNEEVYCGILGLQAGEVETLVQEQVIY
jgi:crotonobetainyl-CoA:carnitine CoA-transferase CaiB-like acyl-CoA transferase